MVIVFLADGFEEIEAITTIDVLRRGGLDVHTVSITEELYVTGAHQMTLKADKTFSAVAGLIATNTIEAVVLPGGMPGTKNLAAHKGLGNLLTQLDEKTVVAAICAAPMVLGILNLLHGKKATCYPGFESHLNGALVQNEPVVSDLPYITSRGAGTAFDFALTLIQTLKNKELADELAESMIYKKKE